MNRVGEAGKGESVWLGWFLHAALDRLRAASPRRAARRRARATWRAHAAALQHRARSATAWDGEWYRRAYFDDGTPLGSAPSDECRIDSIAQSWACISGAARSGARSAGHGGRRAHSSMRRDDGLALLFTPPFDQTPLDPGYIKGYPPGIRENGGQYTHAAAVVGDGLRGARARATRRPSCSAMLNPINHTATRAGVHRYKVEPYVVGRRRLFGRRRMSGAAAGPGTPARPAGCTAPASNRSSACASRRIHW